MNIIKIKGLVSVLLITVFLTFSQGAISAAFAQEGVSKCANSSKNSQSAPDENRCKPAGDFLQDVAEGTTSSGISGAGGVAGATVAGGMTAGTIGAGVAILGLGVLGAVLATGGNNSSSHHTTTNHP